MGLNIFLAILSIAGVIPTIILIQERFQGRRPLRRLLGLSSFRVVEILVTTSKTEISDVGPKDDETQRARRSLIPTGDLAGVAELSVMLSRAYPKKSFILTPSADKRRHPEADQFVIGGPVHNEFCRKLIEGNMSSEGAGTEVIFDAPHRFIKFGGTTIGPDIDLDFVDNVPSEDYGIILLGRLPIQGRSQRVLVAAGLTTYGTHAAAHFVAHSLARYSKEQRFGPRPNVIILIRADFVNGEPFAVHPLEWIMTGPRPSRRVWAHREKR